MPPERPADALPQAELLAKTQSLQTINAIADAVYHSLDMHTVIERALEAIVAYLQTNYAALFLLDESGDYLDFVGEYGGVGRLYLGKYKVPVNQSINGIALKTCDIFVVESLDDPRIYPALREPIKKFGVDILVTVPLLYQGKAIGTFGFPFTAGRQLTEQERETLLSIGKTIGLAIANARYVERVEAEVRERQEAEAAAYEEATLADALRETAAVLNSDLDMDGVLDRILDSVGRIVPGDLASILLIDSHNGMASSIRSRGKFVPEYETTPGTFKLDVMKTPHLRYMAETAQPLVIYDTKNDLEWRNFSETAWVRSCINAPVQIEGVVIGFLNVDSAEPDCFTERDAETLKIFADQAGLAIRNARLYAASRQQAAALEVSVRERTAMLELEQAQLRAVLDSIADGVLAVIAENSDQPQNMNWILNRSLTNMTGYSEGPIDLVNFKSESLNEKEFVEFLDRATADVRTLGFWRGELRVKRRDNTEFDAVLTSTRVDRPGQQGIGSVTVIRDVSQEKTLAEARSRFLTHASHELRTPITNLKTRLYLANRQPERMKTHLHIMEEVVDQMRDIVEYMLELSRLTRGWVELRRERINLRLFLAGIVDIQQADVMARGLSLTLDTPPEPLYITGDSGRLNQVFINLLTNALHHTQHGGVVSISLRREGENAIVVVEDNGEGISPDDLPHIFQPFYRTMTGMRGTGLGLSIAQEIVERHGGKISVDSTLGVGSRFRVVLPLT